MEQTGDEEDGQTGSVAAPDGSGFAYAPWAHAFITEFNDNMHSHAREQGIDDCRGWRTMRFHAGAINTSLTSGTGR